jgi:hypothetical protein
MGANAQTSVPTFTAGQVLTAAQMNDSARTGVPVFADASARDAGFGGTGEKTLAEGQLAYLEDADVVQYYDGSSWATLGPSVGGLTLVKTQTIGTTVSSVTVTDAFSSTYDVYYITVSGGVASTANYGTLKLGATTTGYYQKVFFGAYNNNTIAGGGLANVVAGFDAVLRATTNSLQMAITLNGPNLAKNTYANYFFAQGSTTGNVELGGGYLNDSTQYTDFTITANTGTWTGGEIRVYGYKTS